MRTTVRRRILDYLESHPDATGFQIARRLGMSSPAVRHHLAILRSDGRIDRAGTQPGSGPGRPAVRYRVSERLTGDNLINLADSLLQAWQSAFPAAPEPSLARTLASALKRQLGPVEAARGVAGRITALVSSLNQLHYRAHWEAGAQGPRLIFGHCPYAAVIEKHPVLCKMDAGAIAQTMQAEAEQVAKIDFRGRTATQCVFLIKQPDTATGPAP